MMLRWPLAKKLVAIGSTFLVLALGSIALTLWVAWQLEGGAGAVNEAGRMRKQAYRLALTLSTPAPHADRLNAAQAMDESLELLRNGDPSRPLLVPWDDDTRTRFDALRERWQSLRPAWTSGTEGAPPLREVESLVTQVDEFVSAIERHTAQGASALRAYQFTLALLAIASTVAFFYTGHLFVLDPLQRLKRAVQRIHDDDFSARVEIASRDEFGDLAHGFNTMASHLEALYQQLEARVAEKTEHLEVKRERLSALYEASAFIAKADTLPALADGFVRLMRRVARADGAALRWSDAANQRYLMLAADGLPPALSEAEQCLPAGDCHCGQAALYARSRVIPITELPGVERGHCAQAGYRVLVSVPIRQGERVLGEIDLFFRAERELTDEERSLYETLASHLAARMDSLRAVALEKEAAVSEERTLLAQELHDSIAQSLAFLKIQVQLLKEAMRRHDEAAMGRTVSELEAGVKESYADVRELLLHFRTRASAEDITTALRTTLQKFEHQSGVPAHLHSVGHGVPLAADVQVQVLHVLQEALSNIRKHAHAGEVNVTVHQAPSWRFEVRDNGRGFDSEVVRPETQVGLRIMRERAQRIGATVQLRSQPGVGTTIILALPSDAPVVAPQP